jgi:PD-(D/E)XK nuclease superfamily
MLWLGCGSFFLGDGLISTLYNFLELYMNLLDILSAGKRDLNEENVSSFLAWLLDPGQSHGCGSLFLKHLLQIMDVKKFDFWIAGLVNAIAYRQLSTIKVAVVVEEAVESSTGKRRDVDIIRL